MTTASETAIEAATNTSQAQNSVFPVGSEVEVSSDEEGFKGAWFRATIIDTRKRKKVLVEYYSLVTEDGSQQLREYVDWAHVRPLPPAVGCLSFDVGDVVDADYRDGWWTGVVKKSLGNSKFRVFFDNPPDLIEFHQNQMRVHQDWINGLWVRPKREPQMTGSHFSPGTDVEVNLDSDELVCTWIPAIVVKENKDNTFLVKYHNPKPKHWGITVDFLHIRPPAPRYADRIYKLHEHVDAFCDSAWRPAEITKILAGKTYTVTFKNTMKCKELSRAEIRPQVEWKGGKWEIEYKESWVTPTSNFQEEPDPGPNGIDDAETVFQLECLGAVDDDLEKKPPQSTNTGKQLIQQSTDPNSNSVSSVPTSSVDKTKPVASKPHVRRVSREKKLLIGGVSTSTESPAVETLSQAESENLGAYTTEAGMELSTRIRKPVVPFNFESFTGKRIRSKRQKDDAVEGPQTYPVKRKGRPRKYAVGSPDTLAVGKAQNGTTNPVERDIKDEAELPITIAPSTDGINCILSKVPSQFLDEELQTLTIDTTEKSNDVAEHNSVECERPQTTGGIKRRKRGRPRKFVVLGLEASDEAIQKQKGAECVQVMAQRACPANEDALAQVEETNDFQDVSRRKKADVSTSKSVTMGTGMDSVRQSSSLDEDDRPLSMWFGTLQFQPGNESKSLGKSSLEVLGKTTDQQNGNKEKDDTAKGSHAINASNGSASQEIQRLPFTKTSPVWKVVESMEVFRELPQSPHFRPLYKCKDECREGLAIGSMVTFSSLFNKISQLQFDDRNSILNSILESLVELEKHGFNVSAMKNRVNELLSIKDRHEQLRVESKDAETKIDEYKSDKTKLTEEFADVAKKIDELQKKSDFIKLEIEMRDNEIAMLQKNLDAANQSIGIAQLNFENLRAAPMNLT